VYRTNCSPRIDLESAIVAVCVNTDRAHQALQAKPCDRGQSRKTGQDAGNYGSSACLATRDSCGKVVTCLLDVSFSNSPAAAAAAAVAAALIPMDPVDSQANKAGAYVSGRSDLLYSSMHVVVE
jgi:hypothetical protein